MIRLAAAALFAVLLQDAIELEAKFRATLDRVERAGLTVPDLPNGAAELDAIHSKTLPKDLRDRYQVVRAQAAVLASLHATLLKSKGTQVEIPIPPGKPVKVTLVDVLKRGVKFSRAEGTQELAYGELDPEWCLEKTRSALTSDAALLAGLWLAKAARWEAAFVALGTVESDHPLVLEARKRGIDAAVQGFGSLVKGRRWAEALARLASLGEASPGDARLDSLRDQVLDGMVEHGMELCRKKSTTAMKEIIDLITKHFPDGASRIEDIREAVRWVKIVDPKKFMKLESVKGPPWLLKGPADGAATFYFADVESEFVGLSVKVRFEKGEKKSQGGFVWEKGHRVAWVTAATSNACVASGKPGESHEAYNFMKVSMDGTHTISLRIRDGHYVVRHNGVEYDKTPTRETSIGPFALNACYGNAWIDEVQVLKKE